MKSIKDHNFFTTTVIALLLFALPMSSPGQKSKDVFVDKDGVMKWGDTKKEVYGFGVNYTTPFAHAYRTAKKLNVDIEKAIKDDVYHFARLGLDGFRVHVWDTEISDSLGNLLENEHLKLFDFMLMKMKERGIKIFLTPIAFWGNGYPERDEKTPGFSAKYGKDACLTNPDAIKAQENYLYQFLNHVNSYTKIAYKNDPDIIGFEVSNEPHHIGTPDEVIRYINRMVDSMRKTGCRKPILYNVSHSIHLSEAYYKAGIDGGTFQWYPTGLGARHELRGNFLPNVDQYIIPFASEPGFKKGAKIVYEFDAADIGRSYIYPAMARSFRAAGIQWAAHFAYDPTFMAYANTEYNTHYMNLVYAPQKGLSLKLASEVFHNIPRYKSFGGYPGNTRFGNFRVSYEEDLAEMVNAKKFIYTNTTSTIPPNTETLEEISGFGNSPVVKYEGRGAYFLDKIEDGIWRLEVLPDAIWVGNIFGRNSPQKEVAVINWRTWPMEINIPGLGNNFEVTALNSDAKGTTVGDRSVNVTPGVYLLKRKGASGKIKGSDKWKNIRLEEFAAPKSTLRKSIVLHQPAYSVAAGAMVNIKASVVTPDPPDKVVLNASAGFNFRSIDMNKVSGYEYEAQIPAELVKEGYLNYHISVDEKNSWTTFPSGFKGTPRDWDFYGEPFKVAIVDNKGPVTLFNAGTDDNEVSKEWRRGSKVVPSAESNRAELWVEIDKLFTEDPENKKAPVINDYSMRYNFSPKLKGRQDSLSSFKKLVLRGRSIGKGFPVQIALIDKSGNAMGRTVELGTEIRDHEIDLSTLYPVKLVLLPRPYPTFLPYYFEGSPGKFNLNQAETIQISVGPELKSAEGNFVFTIESIRVEH